MKKLYKVTKVPKSSPKKGYIKVPRPKRIGKKGLV